MAQNGPGGIRRISAPGAPRLVARSQTSSASPPPPLPPSNRAVAADRDLITLAQPRPGVARARNEYIETPLRPQVPTGKGSTSAKSEDSNRGRGSPVIASTSLPRVHGGGSGLSHPHHHHQHHHHHHLQQHQQQLLPPQSHPGPLGLVPTGDHTNRLPILTQPCVTFQKEKAEVSEDSHRESSIICSECRRCKCDACRNPKPLPSTWICGNKYQCSAETAVDYCSCMCCVKGLFYHCAKDYEMDSDVSCADKPCSCNPHWRCLRWGCLGMLTMVLPCLLCYFPLKGCLKMCEACYKRYNSRGCQCRDTTKRKENSEPLHSKRLLDIEC